MDYHRSDTAKKRSKPYTHLTAIQKKKICQRQRDNPNILSYRNLANEYGVGKSTIQDIIFQSKKWFAIDINETSTYCLKNKPPKWPNLEQALWLWTTTIIENNLPLTGEAIIAKAHVYADRLGIKDFKGSDGWLTKYKKRYNLHNIVRHGESASAPPAEFIENERTRLRTELAPYNLDDIYNADETGLFWAMEPSRTLSNREISGHKKNKSKVSILLTMNASGTDKLPPVFIYKYRTPFPLRHVNKALLPVQYYWNSKAHMQVSLLMIRA